MTPHAAVIVVDPGRFMLLRGARSRAAGAAATLLAPEPDDPPIYEL
jgi:hypothetical protein